jgi:hypothetical protein
MLRINSTFSLRSSTINTLEFKMREAVIKDVSCYMENKLAALNPASSLNSLDQASQALFALGSGTRMQLL